MEDGLHLPSWMVKIAAPGQEIELSFFVIDNLDDQCRRNTLPKPVLEERLRLAGGQQDVLCFRRKIGQATKITDIRLQIIPEGPIGILEHPYLSTLRQRAPDGLGHFAGAMLVGGVNSWHDDSRKGHHRNRGDGAGGERRRGRAIRIVSRSE